MARDVRGCKLDVEDLGDSISTIEELAAFIDALSDDAIEHGSQWENIQIFSMLESMAAWLRDTRDNHARVPPDLDPRTLRFVASLLLAGKHYE
jgi:hypothetical protein